MKSRTILVAGATGTLGRCVVEELLARGYSVRALCRRRGTVLPGAANVGADLLLPDSLERVCTGVSDVISCAGASMRLDGWTDRTPFRRLDFEGNANLLGAAARAGVAKFVYISLAEGAALRHTLYADAHERFVELLGRAPLDSTVIRPTGFFSFCAELLHMARKGRALVIGDGEARTNPIHEAEVARACVEALSSDRAEWTIGGPETFSRRELVELACTFAGRRVPVREVPPLAVKAAIAPLAVLQPRIHGLLQFGLEVSLRDVVAPAYGTERLDCYFRKLVTRTQARTA